MCDCCGPLKTLQQKVVALSDLVEAADVGEDLTSARALLASLLLINLLCNGKGACWRARYQLNLW